MRPVIRTLIATTVVALPLLPLQAQGRPGRNRAPRAPSAGELISARRALNLSPQQLVRLDSIERVQFAARNAAMSALRASRDSLCANRRPCALSREEVQGLRGSQNVRGRSFIASDSAHRAFAMNILDSTQRSRFAALREGQRRSAARGMARGNNGRFAPRSGRGAGNNLRGPRRGFDGPRRDFRNQRNGLRRGGFGPVPGPARRYGPGPDDFRSRVEPRDSRRRPDTEG